LKDISAHFDKPSIIDFKLGSKAYNPKKLAKQKFKLNSTSSGDMSFRFCGMQVTLNSGE